MIRNSFARQLLGLASLALGAAGPSTPAGALAGETPALPPAARVEVEFARDIGPIFAQACYQCHGPEKQEAGLRLDRKAEALAGGDSGPAFEPGKSAESLLVEFVAGLDPAAVMPPKGRRLSAEQIGLLRAWIDQGAHRPDDAPAGSTERPGGGHWAFLSPQRPTVPEVKDRTGVRNAIDAFVRAKLHSLGVSPSPEADRTTLIRRLSLDLLGLPPSPADVDRFVGDDAPDAYERVVERLLASPHFGERWGRHWLDLARYADSDGYETDSPRPNAWRYRDWVIDALNRDLPFDRFTTEQLAGDLLPGATLREKTATGFHRNTLTNTEGGVDKEEFRVAAVVDRVNTTGTVWLGLTVACAQCHTHKYDPITHREYYGLFAFFNNADETDLPTDPVPHEMAAYASAREAYDAEHAKLLAALERYETESRPAEQAEWERDPERARPRGTGPPVPAVVAEILATEPGDRGDTQKARLSEYHRTIDPGYAARKKAVDSHAKKPPRPVAAKVMTLAEATKGRRETHVHLRGDFLHKGDAVRPGTPRSLHPFRPANTSPTRLDLVRWLTSPDNPLTSRVTINRVWRHLFGRGLVSTVDDFGTRGEAPSHPELLDWLATEFVVRGWSTKAMIRLIVTSATYRQVSHHRPDLDDLDPNNVWLARQSRLRLEAEVVRDVALAASGLLAPAVGGTSVRPPQPAGISELTFAGSARWVESTGPDRYRRGLYTWFQRTSPYPMLSTFDAPGSNVCAASRERSNTPLQALTLLNDFAFVECARALARRTNAGPRDEGPGPRLRRAFRSCLAREPTGEELAVLTRLLDGLRRSASGHAEDAAILAGPSEPPGADVHEAAAWVALARALLNLDEFLTRE